MWSLVLRVFVSLGVLLQRLMFFGVFARFFALMICSSLAELTSSDPAAAAAEQPQYSVQVWENLGIMPVGHITGTLTRRLRIALFKRAFLLVSKIPLIERNWRSRSQCAVSADPHLRGFLSPHLVTPQPDELSLDKLYEQAVVAGFHDMKLNTDGTHSLDLQHMSKYPVYAGRSVYGGELQLSLGEKRVLSLVTPEGHKIIPTDKEWAHEAMRFRSTFFAYLTIVPHSVWCHGLLGPKLFLAVWELLHPTRHPLFTLLRPFCHDLHKNCARAQLTVFGPTGVLSMVSAMTDVGVQRIIAHAQTAPMYEVRLFDELVWSDDMRRLIEPLWLAIRHDLVQAFLDAHQIGEGDKDATVARLRDFFALHVSERFRTLSVGDMLAYLIFTTCVLHHLWGHLYYGSTDPNYISAYTRTPPKQANDGPTDRQPDVSLVDPLSLCEPTDVSLVRLGVIASIQRGRISVASDFSCTTENPLSQQVFSNFARKMQPLLQAKHEKGYDAKLMEMACSASL